MQKHYVLEVVLFVQVQEPQVPEGVFSARVQQEVEVDSVQASPSPAVIFVEKIVEFMESVSASIPSKYVANSNLFSFRRNFGCT